MKKQKSKKKKAEAKTMPYTTGWRCGTMSQRLRKYRGGFGGGNSW